MEPLTHFLTGACLGRAGFNRKTALATATMTLAAEAPDIDVLGRFHGSVFGFAHHRGFTHSFLGLVLVSAATLGVIYLVWLARGRKLKDPNLPPRWGMLFLLAYIAGLSHILLDFTNNYGIRPFWPFWERWFSWDIVFIVEPVILILLTAALVLPGFFSLISREIGERRKGPPGRIAAIAALAGVVLLWGVRDYEHRRAVAAMQARTYKGADAIRLSAFPYYWNPFRWYGVAETPSFFAQVLIDSAAPEVDPQGEMRIRYKPEETSATLAAKKSYLGRVYLDWAKYPITETEQNGDGFIVHFRDLRYDYPGRVGRSPLGASVELDQSLRVIDEYFGAPVGNNPPGGK